VDIEDSKNKSPRKGDSPMNKPKINESATDEELIGVLTAISVVSKRLARNLIQLEQQKKFMEGATNHEQNKRSGTDHQRSTRCCIIVE
ncbi:hypothetical protein ABHB17_06070, partial [[Eubacterium] siraeum]|jgi:hypothetical protein